MPTVTRESIAIVRQVFPKWSIAIPPTFSETFIEDGGYWHAWDGDRSVSLTSTVVHDPHGPAAAESIIEQLPPPVGKPVEDLPRGLLGWAVEVDADPSAKASRALSGLLAAHSRLLLATITSDDGEWLLRTWLSIRYLASPGDQP
jgi:hypothetical protein